MSDHRIADVLEDLLIRPILPPQMIEDLRAVATMDLSRIESIRSSLELETGLLSAERLTELVGRYSPDEETTAALVRAIRFLQPTAVDGVLARVREWRQRSAEHSEQFRDEDFAALQRNLSTLIQEYPGLANTRKAAYLRKAIGNEFQSIEFVCDLRPVFDTDRKRILEIFVSTTAKVGYIEHGGTERVLEVVLQPNDLGEIMDKARKAEQKIQVLENLLSKWGAGDDA